MYLSINLSIYIYLTFYLCAHKGVYVFWVRTHLCERQRAHAWMIELTRACQHTHTRARTHTRTHSPTGAHHSRSVPSGISFVNLWANPNIILRRFQSFQDCHLFACVCVFTPPPLSLCVITSPLSLCVCVTERSLIPFRSIPGYLRYMLLTLSL